MTYERLVNEHFVSPLEKDLLISDIKHTVLQIYAGHDPDPADLEQIKLLRNHFARALKVARPHRNLSEQDVPDASVRNALREAFSSGDWSDSAFDQSVVADVKLAVQILGELFDQKRIEKQNALRLLKALNEIQLPLLNDNRVLETEYGINTGRHD